MIIWLARIWKRFANTGTAVVQTQQLLGEAEGICCEAHEQCALYVEETPFLPPL